MAKFLINDGFAGATTVEAADYTLSGDVFWFSDEKGESVFAFAREKFISIRRVD